MNSTLLGSLHLTTEETDNLVDFFKQNSKDDILIKLEEVSDMSDKVYLETMYEDLKTIANADILCFICQKNIATKITKDGYDVCNNCIKENNLDIKSYSNYIESLNLNDNGNFPKVFQKTVQLKNKHQEMFPNINKKVSISVAFNKEESGNYSICIIADSQYEFEYLDDFSSLDKILEYLIANDYMYFLDKEV